MWPIPQVWCCPIQCFPVLCNPTPGSRPDKWNTARLESRLHWERNVGSKEGGWLWSSLLPWCCTVRIVVDTVEGSWTWTLSPAPFTWELLPGGGEPNSSGQWQEEGRRHWASSSASGHEQQKSLQELWRPRAPQSEPAFGHCWPVSQD